MKKLNTCVHEGSTLGVNMRTVHAYTIHFKKIDTPVLNTLHVVLNLKSQYK